VEAGLKRRFFDPDPVFVQAATGYVVQTLLTLAALLLGYAAAEGYVAASVVLAGFLLASALLSRLTIDALIAAARRRGHQDQLYYAVRVVPEVEEPTPETVATPEPTTEPTAEPTAERTPLASGEHREPIANRQL